ncbi:hypothetical protein [Actinophytocola gossypii]|uniref:DUF1059 domain-containing protein n=1 Tax=Actinophytocola gossypii TaxID=2812003 RepID=A0ABT2JL44_9PSEU|nr:hypothetical protein [Actinophytocola gossypii]MCT2588244.1 hypothetical protein [Actinophytocola gossypii]
MRNSSTGIWANLDEGCSMTCKVEGSDMATIAIAGENHSLELVFNAEGLRKLAQSTGTAMVEMDALFERENAVRESA